MICIPIFSAGKSFSREWRVSKLQYHQVFISSELQQMKERYLMRVKQDTVNNAYFRALPSKNKNPDKILQRNWILIKINNSST